ncbi:ABC transporter ATP-binding protein [Youngiibacter fragilis]|uniref:ABC transporter n=1 Tax=Youngiibacter fragilis 232.1 TaxID=994573 RepID=V7I103_9CLOT|nr:ABC transporter ATP-binding protein [Youngiibacter fragilis]ETA79925.1 ABC transporter [Youngiibacter fragilis 232.1]
MELDIRNLEFSYGKKASAIFKGFDLNVKDGSILAILGKSGSGKSTLLRIISGLEDRSKGYIRIGDRTVQDENTFIQAEKRNTGFIFQNYALFPYLTVAQNIAFGMKGKDDVRVKEMVSLTRLDGLEKRYPHELSGGQQQRVALARSLAPKPSILLMDEPFSSLDTALVKDLREDLRRIIRSTGMTTIIVTHDEDDARALADETLVLDCQ